MVSSPSAGPGYLASHSSRAHSERASLGRLGSRPGAHSTTRPPSRMQSHASDAARRATWSATSRVGGLGSQKIPTVCTPGGSYSRTTSSPRRALDRQWMRRNGSPGLYSRTPNSSIPEPARGADTLASSSRACGRAMNEVKRGSTRPISPFAPLRRNRKKPSGSLDSRTQLLATMAPRPGGQGSVVRPSPTSAPARWRRAPAPRRWSPTGGRDPARRQSW